MKHCSKFDDVSRLYIGRASTQGNWTREDETRAVLAVFQPIAPIKLQAMLEMKCNCLMHCSRPLSKSASCNWCPQTDL